MRFLHLPGQGRQHGVQTGSPVAHAHYFPPFLRHHCVSYACSLDMCGQGGHHHSWWLDYLDVGLADGCCLCGPFEHGRSVPHVAFLWTLSALHSEIIIFSDLAAQLQNFLLHTHFHEKYKS